MNTRDSGHRQTPAAMDTDLLRMIRDNVKAFWERAGQRIGPGERVLDLAPQDHGGIRNYLVERVELKTLDIDPASNADYICDLCDARLICDNTFDHIICTEVLEHVVQPFAAVSELQRILRPGGCLYVTTPFNFRIHGPLPDCWRFTEHGLRVLLRGFIIDSLTSIDTPDRPLMPIGYQVVARKPYQ